MLGGLTWGLGEGCPAQAAGVFGALGRAPSHAGKGCALAQCMAGTSKRMRYWCRPRVRLEGVQGMQQA